MKDILKERFGEIERLAAAVGLKPYDICYFEVPASLITEVASYGLPTRYSHWSFGKVHQYQRMQGEMGYSHIYELILNNDPSYAFLDKDNSDTGNLLIAAHCLGHSHFFKNNIMFQQCGETNMVQIAKRHADLIDQYRKEYGDDEVDEWLDLALALEQHVDIYKGLKRQRYPQRHIEYQERTQTKWEDIVDEKKLKPVVKKTTKGIYVPPEPEKDILWFLSEYANLEPWQKNIFLIVRRESYYFFPQFKTKIINEGCASFFHAEIMHQYSLGDYNDYGVTGLKYPLTPEEYLDFLAMHEKVVQPGAKIPLKVVREEVDHNGRPTGKTIKRWNHKVRENPRLFNAAIRINPYYVGYRMLRNIKDRWDKYYKDGYRKDEFGQEIPVTINGLQKVFEVLETEDDVSFFKNYLTEELCDELHLFAYGNNDLYDDSYETQEQINEREQQSESFGDLEIDDKIIENKTVVVRSKDVKNVVKAFARARNNYGVPVIVVRRVDEAGMLRLEHVQDDAVNIDVAYAEYVLKYIFQAWGRPVELIRKDVKEERTWILSYDGISYNKDYQTIDYPECIEKDQRPSSW